MLKSFVVTPQNGAITANGQSAVFNMDKQTKSLRGATGRLGRFDFVVGGSTPSFTTRIDVQCENPNNT